MHEGATWLCERVLPEVPLRQFVLSLPKALRYLLAYDGKLCRSVAKTALQEIFRFQRMQARKALGISSTRQAHTGAMVAVQRFGSALNLNVHFHALVLDGVYVQDAFGHLAFFVESVDAIHAKLVAKGVHFSLEPKTMINGTRIAFAVDPTGYKIEWIENPQRAL